jgi:hypothetical protein
VAVFSNVMIVTCKVKKQKGEYFDKHEHSKERA